jgi:hypothetical protein
MFKKKPAGADLTRHEKEILQLITKEFTNRNSRLIIYLPTGCRQ